MKLWVRVRKNGSFGLGIRMDDPRNAIEFQCEKCEGRDWIEKMGGYVCSKCRHFVHRNYFKGE